VDFKSFSDQSIRYIAAKAPGFAKFLPSALTDWDFPFGKSWNDEKAVGPKLKKKAEEEMAKQGLKAANIPVNALEALDVKEVEALQARCASVLSSKRRKTANGHI